MNTGRPEELGKQFAEMARVLLAQDTVQQTLDKVAALAPTMVEGCDAAGVMRLHGQRRVETQAATDKLVWAYDQLQTELGEGPCVDAIWKDHVFQVDDMAQETRWPRYVPRVLELGVRSVLSFQLYTLEDTLGALDLFSRRSYAFTDHSREVGWIFASHVAVAFAGAQRDAQLREAIETREVIGEAIGILMQREHITERAAFDVLKRASNDANIKLREVARHVAETGANPLEG